MSSHPLSATPPSSEGEISSQQDARGADDGHAFALHEVSNALTVVLGWLDLGIRAETQDELRHALHVAREHAKRGQVLARRAIGAAAESSRGSRSAHEIAEFVAESLRPAALERNVTIDLETESTSEGAVNDEASLVQILTNLLLNAISFTPAGTSVELGLRREGDDFVFAVEDQGAGVPTERRARLFTPSRSTREGGAGLGLAHSRTLARQRSGDVRYLPGRVGARFEVLWPVARSTAVRPSVRALAHDALAGVHVLLIEDDAAVASLVEMSCEARGASVVSVADADRLSEVIGTDGTFDVVLMDLSPLEGCLLSALDEIALRAPRAQLVLMSGQPNGVPAGCEGRFATWMRKPFDMEQLIGSIASLLGERTVDEEPSGRHAL